MSNLSSKNVATLAVHGNKGAACISLIGVILETLFMCEQTARSESSPSDEDCMNAVRILCESIAG